MRGASAEAAAAVRTLKRAGSARNVAGMARYGIRPKTAFGVPAPVIKALARSLGRSHALALELRATGVFEARALAALVEEPEALTPALVEAWVREFESWADCDSTCLALFWKAPFAYRKARAWTRRGPEIERRAGFALIVALAVHDKKAPDRVFAAMLPLLEAACDDERNLVKKAVSWALRTIGKRSVALNRAAVASARRIARRRSKAARWIAADALRELTSPQVRARLGRA